jgi:hypothetical protein
MNTPRVKSPNAHLLDNPEWLRSEYFDKNKSLLNICESIPCAKLTVLRRFKKYGIETKPKYVTYSDVVYSDRKGASSPTWKGGTHRCPDCNIEIGYRYSKNNKPVRCDLCASKFYRGDKHHSWKPPEERQGTEAEQLRNSIQYDEWRYAVYKRDKNLCQICGIRKDPMIAHHLDGFGIFPEKRFDVDNGVTLCNTHHLQFHRMFGFGKNTAEQFQEYVEQMTVELVY